MAQFEFLLNYHAEQDKFNLVIRDAVRTCASFYLTKASFLALLQQSFLALEQSRPLSERDLQKILERKIDLPHRTAQST